MKILPPSARLSPASRVATILLAAVLYPAAAAAQSSADARLRRMADELLPRVEVLSGISATQPLNIASRTREELEAYLRELAGEEVLHEMRMLDLVYRRLGLVDSSLDLANESVELLTEQVLGYYDAERDSLFVLGDVPAEQIRNILVHEMVHALQDQLVPLDSLLDADVDNDRYSAIRAAIEGHAELVEIHFYIDELNERQDAGLTVPDLTRVALEFFFADNPRPMLAAAPPIVRDAMIFPYIRGAGFVQALRRREPFGVPFRERMPQSSEQVLDPDSRFFDRLDPPVELEFLGDRAAPSAPAAGATGTPWVLQYENTLGQFELVVLLRERHAVIGTEKFALGWGGDRYRLYADGDRQVLVWYVAWDDSRSAWNFANTYRQILNRRLNRSGWVEELTIDGASVVRIIEASEPMDSLGLPRPEVRLQAGP